MQKTNDLQVLLGEILSGQNLLAGVLSKPRKKGDPPYGKVSLRPVELRGILHYQATYHYPDREIHDNLTVQDAKQLILQDLEDTFRQANFYTVQADWQVLVSKKGVVKILQHPPSRQKSDVTLEHNRSKRYLLKEGVAYPFLVELGVMNSSGKVLAKRYHKFRQLNKYLEIVEDCLPYLTAKTNGHPLTIVDFGSGKAYLTFALYHFLVEHLGLNVELIGLDLKKDVVSFCNQMAEKLGYDNLKFLHQDIRDFEATGKVDMVVSLHACDVATDFALAQAVKWQTKVILAVPCCQHELFGQLDESTQPVLLKHGILKERIGALITDAARAQLLEMEGYDVRVMEFIDLEHTPKNLLIRALRQPKLDQGQASQNYQEFKEFWRINPSLEVLLAKEDGDAES